MPKAGTPGYRTLTVTAVSDLLLGRWIAGEAKERDISVTDRQIDTELESVIQTSFAGKGEYEKFLKDSGLSEDDARERIELQLLAAALEEDVTSGGEDQEAAAAFQEEFLDKWRELTVCSDDLLADDDGSVEEQLAERCSNFEGPDGSAADEPPAELPVDPADGSVEPPAEP